MFSPVRSILRQFTRKPDEKLNILFYKNNERFARLLHQTGHFFFDLSEPEWNFAFAQEPSNYTKLYNNNQLDLLDGFDLVISTGRRKDYDKASQLSKVLHLPLLLIEEDYPLSFDKTKIAGHENVFISKHQAETWRWKKDYTLIDNAVQSDVFFRRRDIQKENRLLACVNSWQQKDMTHGFSLANQILTSTDCRRSIYGGDIAFVHHKVLAEEMNKCLIYLNTTQLVASPMGAMEAASCGCCVVTYDTSNIRDIFNDDEAVILPKDTSPKEAARIIDGLFKDMNKAKAIGERGMHRMQLRNKNDVIKQYNEIFIKTANKVFKGEPSYEG